MHIQSLKFTQTWPNIIQKVILVSATLTYRRIKVVKNDMRMMMMDLLGKHESCINHDISIIVSNQHAIHANLPKPTDWQHTQWRSIGPFVKGFHLSLHCIISAPAWSLEVATSVTLPWLVCGRCCYKIPQTHKPEFVRTNLHNLITLPIPLGNVRNFIPLCISHLKKKIIIIWLNWHIWK